jgi:ParB family chromosome partitioning protein
LKSGEIALSEIEIGPRVRRELGDTLPLMKSMETVGLLHPVVLDSSNKLIAGRRRIEAARRLGWETIRYVVADSVTDAEKYLLAEQDENTCRKDMTPSEKVAMGEALRGIVAAKAKERKTKGVNQHTEPSGKFPEGSKGDTRDIIGKAVGLSGPTLQRATAVVDAAAREPDKFYEVKEEMDRTGKVQPAYDKVKGSLSTKTGEPKSSSTRQSEASADDAVIGGDKQREIAVSAIHDVIDYLKRSPLMRIGVANPHREYAYKRVIGWLRSNMKDKANV